MASSVGPASGIDYGTMINSLLAIEKQPVNTLSNQVKKLNSQDNSFLSLSAKLTSLQLLANNFTSKAVFRATNATSSNTSVLTATSSIGTATGAYSFTVKQLATSSQIATQGFRSQSTSLSDLGVLPASAQSRRMDKPLSLSQLNGGQGVDAGSIMVNMKDGSSVTIDLSSANTIDDVVSTINSAAIGLSAKIDGDRLVLDDSTGGGGAFSVTNVGSHTTASDLGLTVAASGTSINGSDVNKLSLTTELSTLNGGAGVRSLGSSLNDFSIASTVNGTTSTYNISLNGATTVEDVLDKINTATKKNGQAQVIATIDPTGHGIKLVDINGGTLTVAALNSSNAAADLGLAASNQTGYIDGKRLNSGLNSALLSQLNSGAGVTLGTIRLTDRAGGTTDVDLSHAATVNDVLKAINGSGSNVTAALNADGNAFVLTDSSGGSGTLSVSDVSGKAAAGLGILSSVTSNTLTGTDTKINNTGSGTLYFRFGNQFLNDSTKLSELNGGKGVSRGSIRITDSSGTSSNIDLSSAVDIQDVIDSINSTTTLNISAKIGGDHGDQIVITDNAGGAGTLKVSNVGSATTADDLGLTSPASNAGGVLTGGIVNKLSLTSSLNMLNAGLGVRTTGSENLADFNINFGDGTTGNVKLYGTQSIGDVLTAINNAANIGGTQKLTAQLSSDGHSINLVGAAGQTYTLSATNGSNALRDLGLTGDTSTGTLSGTRLISGLQSAQLSELNGGAGIRLGNISITNRLGAVSTVNLDGAQTVSDVISAINKQGTGVTAALNSAGNGITLSDGTGATTGTFTVSGAAASDLGIAQTVSSSTINSKDLHVRSMSDNTAVSTLNGGSGFTSGKIMLTDSTGVTSTIDLNSSTITTLGDLIKKLNANATSIRASLNANGDGILLTDSSSGTITASVAEVGGGTTATSLNLLGSFNGKTKNGSFEKAVTIQSSDTLTTISNKINAAGVGVSASIINDGSGTNPYRLSISSRYSGQNGRLMFDGSAMGLTSTTLVEGQDAVVSYGSGNGIQAVSSNNTFSTLVPGLTITAASVGAATVTVARDDSKIVDSVQEFVDSYNDIMKDIGDLTKFDASNSNNNGVLFGNSTIRQVEQALSNFVNRSFTGVGGVKSLLAVGISFKTDTSSYDQNNDQSVVTSSLQLSLDKDKLQEMLTSNPEDVRLLFTTKASTTNSYDGGIGAIFNKLADQFTNSENGTIFNSTDAIEKQILLKNDRIDQLNTLIDAKRTRWIKQYANLEVTIAKMQSQSSALSAMSSSTSSSSK